MTTKTSGFLGFPRGALGIAISSAMVLLTPFVAKLFEGNDALGDAVKKLRENADQTALSTRANAVWERSVDGMIAKSRTLTDELTKQLKTQQQLEQEHLSAEQRRAERIQNGRAAPGQGGLTQSQEELNAARREAADARRLVLNPGFGTDPEAMPGLLAAASLRKKKVAAAEERLKRVRAGLSSAQQGVRQAEIPILERRVADSLDAGTAAADRYTEALGKLRSERTSGAITAEQFYDRDRANRQVRDAAIKKAQDEKAAERSTTRSRQQVLVDFQRELASRGVLPAAGASQHRTAEDQNRQFRAGLSPLDGYRRVSRHQSDQAFDPSRATQSDRAAYEAAQAAGLKGFKIVNESGGRKHYEWKGAGKRGEVDASGSETTTRQMEATRQKGLADDFSYVDEERQARRRLIDATRKSAASEEERYALLREEIEVEAGATKDKIAIRLAAGKIKEEEAAHLLDLNERTRTQRLQNVAIERASATINRQFDVRGDSLEAEIAQLRIQLDMAKTLKDRRRIAELLLSREQEQARLALERVRDDPNSSAEDVQRAKDALGRRPEQEKAERKRQEEENLDPLSEYRNRLKKNTDDMRSALQSVAVDGLETIESSILGLVDGTETVAGAFRKMTNAIISDLMRIAIEKLIVKAIGTSVFGFSSGGEVQAHADGGPISGRGTGTSDSILSWLSNGEFVVKASMAKKYGPALRAINSDRFPRFANGGSVGGMPALAYPRLPAAMTSSNARRDRLVVDANVNVKASPMFHAEMESVSLRTVGAAAEPIMAGAKSRTLRELNRSRLPGGITG